MPGSLPGGRSSYSNLSSGAVIAILHPFASKTDNPILADPVGLDNPERAVIQSLDFDDRARHELIELLPLLFRCFHEHLLFRRRLSPFQLYLFDLRFEGRFGNIGTRLRRSGPS